MKRRIRSTLVAVCLLAGAPVFAQGPLGRDPTAIPEFTGTASFNADDQLLVEVDFAVFRAGVYPNDGINGNDPSNGTEFVYAYQAFNISPARPMTTLSVQVLDGSGAHNAIADVLHELIGGLEPTFMEIDPISMSFVNRFTDPPLNPDEYSSVVLFTSPNEPMFAPATVQSGGLSDQKMVPTPVPEPTSSVLLGFLVLIALRFGRS